MTDTVDNPVTVNQVAGSIIKVKHRPTQNKTWQTYLYVQVLGRTVTLTIKNDIVLIDLLTATGATSLDELETRNIVLEVKNDYVTGFVDPRNGKTTEINPTATEESYGSTD